MKRYGNISVLHSCVTGRVLWIRRCQSREAERKAFGKVCRKEIERVRQWSMTMVRRKKNIMRLLSDVTNGIGITERMSPQHRSASRQLQAIAENPAACDRDFYEHIMEMQRRKKG